MEGRFFVYLLECADGSYYVGQTEDLDKRVAEHEAGGHCEYTSPRRPIRLVWFEKVVGGEEATSRELQIKGWSRRKKQALITGDLSDLRRAARI